MLEGVGHKVGFRWAALGWIPEELGVATVRGLCDVLNRRGIKLPKCKRHSLGILYSFSRLDGAMIGFGYYKQIVLEEGDRTGTSNPNIQKQLAICWGLNTYDSEIRLPSEQVESVKVLRAGLMQVFVG